MCGAKFCVAKAKVERGGEVRERRKRDYHLLKRRVGTRKSLVGTRRRRRRDEAKFGKKHEMKSARHRCCLAKEHLGV